jgi:hypothetical protein
MKQIPEISCFGVWLGIAALALAGCSRSVVLPRESLEPGNRYENARVVTEDGFEYRFDRVVVLPDSVRGEYHQEVQRQSASQGIYYEDVVRAQAVPMTRVSSLSVKQSDPSRTFFAGVGAAAVVMLFKSLFESDLQAGGGGSSRTKPDPS